MISIEDCIAMCDLSREEVDAIAEHEHIEEIAATALANALMMRDGGSNEIRAMIRDNIHLALEQGDRRRAREQVAALRHFIRTHPECVRA